MTASAPDLLVEPVASCPYCLAPIHRGDPRELDHAGHLSHLACLDAEPDGVCAFCSQPVTRRQAHGKHRNGTLAHATCAEANGPAPPVSVPRPEVTDPLTLALLEIGHARSALRGEKGLLAVSVGLHPRRLAELDRLTATTYAGARFATVVGLPMRPDPSIAIDAFVLDPGAPVRPGETAT